LVHIFPVVQARGPASEKFAERLAAECADYWQSGRYLYVVFSVADPGSGAFLTPGSGIQDG
jgi:hypothetical protein